MDSLPKMSICTGYTVYYLIYYLWVFLLVILKTVKDLHRDPAVIMTNNYPHLLMQN